MSAVNFINNNLNFNTYAASYDVGVVRTEDGTVNQRQTGNSSVNEYGDEYVRSSIIETADGAVYNKTTGTDAARVPGGEELPEIDSLVGYTVSQAEQFYYEGRISRYDYDQKIEQHDELLEKEGALETSDKRLAQDKDRSNDVRGDINNREIARDDQAKADQTKADQTKANRSDAYDKAKQDTDNKEKVYESSRDTRREVISDANDRARVLNARMSAIEQEERSNEEFEIIESGNDSAATFRLVQNLTNPSSSIAGEVWNIA